MARGGEGRGGEGCSEASSVYRGSATGLGGGRGGGGVGGSGVWGLMMSTNPTLSTHFVGVC